MEDLFDPSWEIRHGSAIALREIVRLHGSSGGRLFSFTKQANDVLNQIWLIDMAIAAICILSLDRFGDFLFDQVVAPVRENAAQMLGCCVTFMKRENSSIVIGILLEMLDSECWETRHGGILGLKYSLNVLDKGDIKHNLQVSFDAIFKCLSDASDDVSAEAAASLLPVSHLLNVTIPDKTYKLIKFLWEHITDLDELTTSTSNIILLLASLITSSSEQLNPNELVKSLPKLWSLLNHTSTNVRVSVLRALVTLLKPQKTSCLDWMPEHLLSNALRLIFQRAIVENMEEVRPLITEVWTEIMRVDGHDDSLELSERLNLLKSTSQFLNYWLCLTMQPPNVPIDRGNPFWLNIRADGSINETKPEGEIYLGSCSFNAETIDSQKGQVTKSRLLATNLLGFLYATLVKGRGTSSQHLDESRKYLSDMFIHYLKTKSSQQRMICGWAIEFWGKHQVLRYNCDNLPDDLKVQLISSLQETNLCYDELAATITRLQQEAREFVSSLLATTIPTSLPHSNDRRIIYNLNQVQTMCDMVIESELSNISSKKTESQKSTNLHDIKESEIYGKLYSKQLTLRKSYRAMRSSQKSLSLTTLGSLACALISWRTLPLKLKFVADPLLDSIESESDQSIQSKSVNYLIPFLDMLCEQEVPESRNLVDSIINRLVEALQANSLLSEYDNDPTKIILLDNLQRRADTQGRGAMRRHSSISTVSGVKRSHSLTSVSSEVENSSAFLENELAINVEVKMRGVTAALNRVTEHFADRLPEKIPQLWTHVSSDLMIQISSYHDSLKTDEEEKTCLKLIRSIVLLKTIGEKLDQSIRSNLLKKLLPELVRLLSSKQPLIRHHSSECIGLISKLMFIDVEEMLTKDLFCMLEQDENIVSKCGSIEAVAFIIENLQLDLVSKINTFIVHVLRRMSDQNDQIRLMATHCFGKLLSLVPLNLNRNENSTADAKVAESVSSCGLIGIGKGSQNNGEFIEQLLDPKSLKDFHIPFETNIRLRSYQQEGLNWLAFLNRFNLHGILCDEMGLGKTFMTICMVASDHFHQDSNSKGRLPSLIVCPSTLIQHWLFEIEKFVPTKTRAVLNPVAYAGSIGDRMNLRNRIMSILKKKEPLDDNKDLSTTTEERPINIVVTSYDIVRNDIEFFRELIWNYCVLDEGHIIKNGRTKLSKAIRFLTATHRLILSGTPIQNNVTELWSLFDFLMPGFLGSERQFNNRYTKPILQSREPKCSSRDLEAGALAMESLHRQVLPFILRRLKEDVLDDLPPKIIQDYYCELSPLQSKLYEDFTHSRLCKDVTKKSLNELADESVQVGAKAQSKSHVFQALQYLKNVCNHPKLVLTTKHPNYLDFKKMLDSERGSLDDISHSSKLKALKQLLIDCGIGVSNQNLEETPLPKQQIPPPEELETVVNQHRALIFCQLRSMVNIVENDLLKKHLSNITYLRLDGSVPVNQRQSIVSRFNTDPSIDILLLTTQIGGLGLNLTGADTVIFVEHDWNPTRDLQAMDRAHRIGQKKVVNVYRLITKGTLEEKIMGLQKFKTMVSSSVINQDNAGLNTMNVDQLLGLFEDNSDTAAGDKSNRDVNDTSRKASASNFIESLPELWDQQQYDTEYDLSSFVSSLKG